MTREEWMAEGKKLFGDDMMKWRFVCPVCGHVAAAEDWLAAGATGDAIAFSCVGRWIEGSGDAFKKGRVGPCNYAGGGLFRLNPVSVIADGSAYKLFDFAREEKPKDAQTVA